MILHIPHSSDIIPEQLRDQIVLSDDALTAELLRMTDLFTDELFVYPEATTVRFPVSRLLVDVERFPDDINEPMSKVGMGMIYTRTAHGNKLKRKLHAQEKRTLVSQYYETHHRALLAEVKDELEKRRKALIVDCHSFPNRPLPCDKDQTILRPDFCIGTDSFHTPVGLSETAERCLEKMGYTVAMNRPYKGTLVPIIFFRKDRHVVSIMIEVNRSLYMDEIKGTKKDSFEFIKRDIRTLLYSIDKFQQEAPPINAKYRKRAEN